jgi:hypothetical protein
MRKGRRTRTGRSLQQAEMERNEMIPFFFFLFRFPFSSPHTHNCISVSYIIDPYRLHMSHEVLDHKLRKKQTNLLESILPSDALDGHPISPSRNPLLSSLSTRRPSSPTFLSLFNPLSSSREMAASFIGYVLYLSFQPRNKRSSDVAYPLSLLSSFPLALCWCMSVLVAVGTSSP